MPNFSTSDFGILNFSEPDMFVVFIMSLLLVLPPLTVSVYLWTSVARFYDEIKHYEKAVKHLSRKHTTMRLVGNLIVTTPDQEFSITPRTFNTSNKALNNTTGVAGRKNGLNNTLVLKKLGNSKDTKSMNHKNEL